MIGKVSIRILLFLSLCLVAQGAVAQEPLQMPPEETTAPADLRAGPAEQAPAAATAPAATAPAAAEQPPPAAAASVPASPPPPAPAAVASPADPAESLITNVFSQTDLRQALEDVAAQAGVNIIADPSVQGVVSVNLEEATVQQALTLLLAGTEYQFERFPNYFLVFSADETTNLFSKVAQTQIVQVFNVSAETARGLLSPQMQRYVRADPAADTLAITAPRQLLTRILRDIAEIDVPAAEDTVFIPLEYVTAATARSLLPENLQRFVRADAERNTLAISGPRGSREVILEQVFRLDVPRTPGNFGVPAVYPTQVVKLQNATAASALALLPASVQNYVRGDLETNTVAVSAPDAVVDSILADIASIDVPRRQIMLDARVVVLERVDLLDFGAEWRLPQISAGAVISDAAENIPYEIRIGYTLGREFTNGLNLTLNMLTANNEATVISSPKVLAQDGRESEIKVTTEEYFQITAESEVFLRSELEKIETGTILGITPQIGPDGKLTLNMRIEVSDVVARGEQNLPVVSRRTARGSVQIESGGTAAVAGLSDTRQQLGRDGVPGLANVPLLGRAFRTDRLNHQARQVAVFVTATLVDENDKLFKAGRKRKPPAQVLDEETFRHELEAALNSLESRPTK